jgi:hypothetical protein
MKPLTELTGLTQNQLTVLFITLIVVGGAVARPELAGVLIPVGERITQEIIRAEIEEYIDQDLGGSP